MSTVYLPRSLNSSFYKPSSNILIIQPLLLVKCASTIMVWIAPLVSTLAVLATAAHGAAVPAKAPAASPGAQAVYFQTNQSPNHIMVIAAADDGTLSYVNKVATGGNGGNTVDDNGNPSAPDPLSSQDSVKVFGNVRFHSL